MYSLNRVQLIGNLTRDPELRYTPNGQAVCSFGIATNRRWKDKEGNNQEATDFTDVVAWGKMGEILNQYSKRGNKIYIEGRLQTRSWEAQDGTKKFRTEVVADDFVFLTPKGAAGTHTDEVAPVQEMESSEESAPEITDEPKKSAKKDTKEEPASKTADDEINLDEIPF